ncbi:hypothetical protein GCM10017044_16780 [Kordiimonas sediminis]|uniref:Uncharacterized protein n=1 Tax=Kordiimonas sediminis TaxID=1735581 RepID=A0A919E7Z7_9PROT|nr:hypothetical protein [Kordiimonas sediminis]GHF23016.1 hypothetical protein GCM10017044_16780 [Kordiimonas sediminis]
MKSGVFAGVLLIATTGISAQDVGVSSDHQPNEYTQACLVSPDWDCAISAALQTVIEESLPLERSKVLVGVARAMIEAGDIQKGKDTLELAMAEARSARLDLVTQDRLKSIAPLFARSGDFSSAIALAEEITIPMLKDRTMIAISEEAILQQDPAAARVAINQISNKSRAFWQRLNMYVRVGSTALAGVDLNALHDEVKAIARADYRYRGLVSLAVLAYKQGNMDAFTQYSDEAADAFGSVYGGEQQAFAATMQLKAYVEGGMPQEYIDEALERASSLARNTSSAELALQLGPLEAKLGQSEAALSRLRLFSEPGLKAEYLASLDFNGHMNGTSEHIKELLSDLSGLDGAYDRDQVRLILLENAIANKARSLALDIVATMEDDDNQAYGLSVSAGIL